MKKLLILTMLLRMVYSQSAHLEIRNVNLTEGTLDIYMDNDVPVSAFQFQLTGLTLLNASSGDIIPDDWLVYGIGNDYWNNVIGYTPSPNLTIPIGEGLLISISFTEYLNDDICIPIIENCGGGADSCPLLVDEYPNVIPTTIGDCISCDFIDDCGVCNGDNSNCLGCTDPYANNYDPDSIIDDGNCEYNDCEEVFNEGYELGALSGDINLDGEHNILDIVESVNMILNP